MGIVHSNQANRFEDGRVFVAHEYDTKSSNLNTARIEINGRYPIEGLMRNNKVNEIVYIESGNGEVTVNGVTEKVGKGDVVSFEAGEKIFWNGKFTLITTCAPAWTKEQHEFLPE